MRDDLIETLRDCANALGELLPSDHAYRKIVEQANRLLDRHDQASNEQRAADALRGLMGALPAGTQTSMMAFRPDVNGQTAGTVKAFLMAENADDLHCAQWVIKRGSATRSADANPDIKSLKANAPSAVLGAGHFLFTPKNGGKPYTSATAPDSWELRECNIQWVPETHSTQEMS